MASVNNFKIFDESKTNLLNISNYGSNTQRVNGFNEDEEIPSKLFNSVLRQNSILSYGLVDYMKNYVSNDITVEHDMNTSDLSTFISVFFNKYFENSFNNTTITYTRISMAATKTNGCFLYSLDDSLEILYAPTEETFNNLTHFFVGYSNNEQPAVIKLETKEVKNLEFTAANTIKVCTVDLSSLVPNIVSNLSKYEILMEIYEQVDMGQFITNHYKSEVIPLERLKSLGYHYVSPQAGDEITGTQNMFITAPESNYNLYIGLGSTDGESIDPSIGKYLIIINNNGLIENCNINISLRERV